MKKFFGVFGLGAILIVCLQGTMLWIGASAITSGVKALKDDCGRTYGIESVVAGDWFCPK